MLIPFRTYSKTKVGSDIQYILHLIKFTICINALYILFWFIQKYKNRLIKTWFNVYVLCIFVLFKITV